ncbi:MAG: bifunctional oligoribonuclease/PAP phosphatase NrnA [Candidatus Omnitrophota bacterium]
MKLKGVIKMIRSRKNRRFLIVSHQNLEGDAVGSTLALANLLKCIGKEAIMLSPEPTPEAYMFLPDAKNIRCRPGLKNPNYDVACIVDCTGLDRIGFVRKIIYMTKPIINIDHHVSNDNFGTVNLVEPECSCTGEQIYHLFKAMRIPIDKNAALYMYMAILTDTGSFRYTNTSARTHKIAAELLNKGLNPTYIHRKIYEESHRSHLDLLSAVLSTLGMSKDGRIAWVRITEDMVKRDKATMRGTEDFLNFPRSLKGVKIALAFREIDKDTVKVGFRSNDRVNVCKLAMMFGGGGHPAASGCTVRGKISEVEQAVLLKARRYLRGK